MFEELGQILVAFVFGLGEAFRLRNNEFYLVGNEIFFWLLLWVFLCVYFFMGFVVGLFFVLGCGLGFVWLLLWLWERFFDVVCGVLESGMQLNVYERQGFL